MRQPTSERLPFPDIERIKPYLPAADVSALGRLLRHISLFIAGLLVIFLLSRFLAPGQHSPGVIAAWAGIFFVLALEKSGLDHQRLASTLAACLVVLINLLIVLSDEGIRDSVVLAYPGIIILASLTVSSTQFVAVVVLIGLSAIGLGLMELHQLRFTAFDGPPTRRYLLDILLILAGTAVVARLLSLHLLAQLQRVHWQALVDSLTGLPNRRALDCQATAFLAGARQRQMQSAALALHIDRLDHLNHNFGHALGDAALSGLGQRLAALIGEDAFIARQTGDTIMALYRYRAGDDSAEGFAARLLDIVRSEQDLGGIVIRLDGSCAIRPDPGAPAEAQTLLADALIALDVAASNGSAAIIGYQESFGARVRIDYLIESALRTAIDRGVVTMHYQPILAHPGGEVLACEALLRLHGPAGEPLPALEAVQLAEASGLIHRLGGVILDSVLDDLVRLRNTGAPTPPIAVNCSGLQVAQPDFAARIIDALAARGLPGSALILEITETAAISGNEQLAATLRAIAANGTRIALDDFGAGHSSLHRLKELQADIIKFDRSLIVDIGREPESLRFLEKAIELVAVTRPLILLEGIDAADQVAALAGLPCHAVQGYWYARPMPLGELPLFLASRKEEAAAA